MRKIFKALIALVVIAVAAVIVYSLVNKGNKNTALYLRVVEFNEMADEENNITDTVNGSIDSMISFIESFGVDMQTEYEYLSQLKGIISVYSPINDLIKVEGFYINNNNNSKIVSNLEKNYSYLKSEYKDGYDYLKDTYLAIDTSSEGYHGMVIEYIKNFVTLFGDVLNHYNEFYYNAGMLYVNGTRSFSQSNNLKKLYVAFYVELANNLLNESASEYKNDIYNQLILISDKICANELDKYLENKNKIDTLKDAVNDINLDKLSLGYVTSISDYLESITSANEKSLASDFVTYVLEV